MSLAFYEPTEWRIVTSAGAEIDVGLGRIFFLGAERGAFYVQQGQGAIQRLPFLAGVGGVGLAVSAGGFLTLSVSSSSQPGGGWRIYRNRTRRDSLSIEDFVGFCYGVSYAGAVGFSGSLSLVFFGLPTLLRVTGVAGLPGAAMAAKAAGILWGSAETSMAGVSGNNFNGHVFSGSPAHPGETG